MSLKRLYKSIKNKYLVKFSKFGLIGFIISFFVILGYYVSLEILNFPLYSTYIVVYLLGVFFSYYLNSKFTYNARVNFRDCLKYISLYLTSLAIGVVLLFFIEKVSHHSQFVNVLIAVPPRIALNFILVNYFIFNTNNTN